MTDSMRGKNQKISGDSLQKNIYDFLKVNYPQSNITMEAKIYGSMKLSVKTGKMKPKLNKVDILWDKIAISSKNQIMAGTAEQKLIYELCMIKDYMSHNEDTIKKAYIVYGGNGMRIIEEELKHIPIFKELFTTHFTNIEIISYNNFTKRYHNENISTEMGREQTKNIE